MAKPKKKGYGGKQSSRQSTKSSSNWMLLGGIAVAIVAIIAVGAMMLNQPRQAAAGESASAAGEPTATPADRTERYIGPESNPEEVNEALAGKLGLPAVVFFHADW